MYVFLNLFEIVRKKSNGQLKCFKFIVSDPPRPLTEEDIWFQIGHVHEQQKDVSFKDDFMKIRELTAVV